MTKQQTDGEILLEIYRRMFKEAEPRGNIDEMVKTGETKERDFFLKYFLPEERQGKIVEEVCKENKVPKHKINAFNITVCLGSSPTANREVMLKHRKV